MSQLRVNGGGWSCPEENLGMAEDLEAEQRLGIAENLEAEQGPGLGEDTETGQSVEAQQKPAAGEGAETGQKLWMAQSLASEQNPGLAEDVDIEQFLARRSTSAQTDAVLGRVLSSLCPKHCEKLVDAVSRATNRLHLYIETVNNYKAKLVVVQQLTHGEISKMSSDFRSDLMGYLKLTYADCDRLDDYQMALATVMQGVQAVSEPLPVPPSFLPPFTSPPLTPQASRTRPMAKTRRAAAEAASAAVAAGEEELQTRLHNVVCWVSNLRQPYSQFGDNEQGQVEKKPKKSVKMKKISGWQPYQKLEDMDSEGKVTSTGQPREAATSSKTSSSTDYLTEPSSPDDTVEPSYSMTFVDAPRNAPDEAPGSADGVSGAVEPTAADTNFQVSRAEETQAENGAAGISQGVYSPLESKGSDRSKIAECQTTATAVPERLQLIAPSSIGANGEGIEPMTVSVVASEEGTEPEPVSIGGSGEDAEPAPEPVGASGEDREPAPEPVRAIGEGGEPATVPVGDSGQDAEPASIPVGEIETKPGPVFWVAGSKRNWVRVAAAAVIKAITSARPSVPASGPASLAAGEVPAVTRDIGDGNGDGNGNDNGNGTESSGISALKPPSLIIRPIASHSSGLEVLEELQRQNGLFRQSLLRHSRRLWLEVKGRRHREGAATAREARDELMAHLKETLRAVELELRDAHKHVAIRAGCVLDIGRSLSAASAAARVRGRPVVLSSAALAPSPAPSENSCCRFLRLLCFCFAWCIPRRH